MTASVPFKEILRRTIVRFNAHVDAQSVKHCKGYKGLYDVYTMLHSECCKCARIKFHYANGLVALRTLEQWFPNLFESLPRLR